MRPEESLVNLREGSLNVIQEHRGLLTGKTSRPKGGHKASIKRVARTFREFPASPGLGLHALIAEGLGLNPWLED